MHTHPAHASSALNSQLYTLITAEPVSLCSPLLQHTSDFPAAMSGLQSRWSDVHVQALWECLQILKTTGPAVHASLAPDILSLLSGLAACCCHEHSGIHWAAASCVGALASSKPDAILPVLLR